LLPFLSPESPAAVHFCLALLYHSGKKIAMQGSLSEGAGTATAVTEGVVFFFFLENATFLQKKLQFFLEKGRFPIDSLVIIGV
jgi:hypothetical protein